MELAQGTINVVSASVSSNKVRGLTCHEFVVAVLYLTIMDCFETIFIISVTVKHHGVNCNVAFYTAQKVVYFGVSFDYSHRWVILAVDTFCIVLKTDIA